MQETEDPFIVHSSFIPFDDGGGVSSASGLPSLTFLRDEDGDVQMEQEPPSFSGEPLPYKTDHIRAYIPSRFDNPDDLQTHTGKEQCLGIALVHALFKELPIASTIAGTLDRPDIFFHSLSSSSCVNEAITKLNVPMSVVSEHPAGTPFTTVLSALSMASFGGPIGATVSFPQKKHTTIAISGHGDGTFSLVDPHQDPRMLVDPRGGFSRLSSFPPLGGYSAVHETHHDIVSLAEYVDNCYVNPRNSGSDQGVSAVFFVPAVATSKGKEEENDEKVPSPSVGMKNLVIETPVVVFQDEEIDEEGKRKRLQPAPGSPMRIESEESEEKRSRTPPVTTTAIPTATKPVAAVVKPKRKSTTTKPPTAKPLVAADSVDEKKTGNVPE